MQPSVEWIFYLSQWYIILNFFTRLIIREEKIFERPQEWRPSLIFTMSDERNNFLLISRRTENYEYQMNDNFCL